MRRFGTVLELMKFRRKEQVESKSSFKVEPKRVYPHGKPMNLIEEIRNIRQKMEKITSPEELAVIRTSELAQQLVEIVLAEGFTHLKTLKSVERLDINPLVSNKLKKLAKENYKNGFNPKYFGNEKYKTHIPPFNGLEP